MPITNKLLVFLLISTCSVFWWLAGLYLYLEPNLAEVEALRDIKLQTPMRIMSRDGLLISQFGEQKRSPIQFDQIPQRFINALLAAEDDQFFEHWGVDLFGLARATSELITTGKKRSGGSTLTMQVARNYFLSFERTFLRKFNEILLALKIEHTLSKEEIFELYVNRIFLGHRAYGFEAAAQTYYGKSLAELTLAQQAMLAGVPKAPSRNNPLSNPETSQIRRNWILGRMALLGMISEAERDLALLEPVTANYYGPQVEVNADYVAEMVRQEMLERFGNAAYNDGYVVYTSIDSKKQWAARATLIDGLRAYDRRHGWRGPERRLPLEEGESELEALVRWREALDNIPVIADIFPAVVRAIDLQGADLIDKTGELRRLSWSNDLAKIHPYRTENFTAKPKSSTKDLLSIGDLVRISFDEDSQRWQLAQIPKVQAALVSMNPQNGAISALVGGMGFEVSKFNRAIQARRQPGSSFKPFLYAAAIANGITTSTLINDAPIVLDGFDNDAVWRPENDNGKFYGPTRLREALTFSRNLVSIRVLQHLGIGRFIDYITKLGFNTSNVSRNLTLALGTHAYTPLEIATGYSIFANGGFLVEPYLIERIEDIKGNVVFQENRLDVACANCKCVNRRCNEREHIAEEEEHLESKQTSVAENREKNSDLGMTVPRRVMDARVSFIVTSILRDVIKRGTGRRARTLDRGDIAGKTGTTNGPRDAWFSGFSPELVTTTWVGFDDYSSLGRREFGGTAALPIWIDYMRAVLSDEQPLAPMPTGVVRLRINRESGLRVTGTPEDSIYEYFLEEFLPKEAPHPVQRGEPPLSADDLEGLF